MKLAMNNSMEKNPFLSFFSIWFPVILYASVIFWFSHIPNLQITQNISYFDKIFHCCEYAVLGFLLARAFCLNKPDLLEIVVFFIVIFISVLYGFSDEYHQSFIQGRTSSLGDVIADGLGGLLGAGTYFFCLKIFNNRG